MFLWCPQATYASAVHQAHECSRQVAERADRAYQISERVLARLTER